MCGIAGWYRRGGRPVSEAAVTAQCDAIRHRGPDDSGVALDGDFGFGMRRLSILDVGGGHQPMFSPDGRFAIVFNGEIYNHREIRRTLQDYAFTTHCDTETILAAYAKWGNEAWAKLEGMFAVAIWDRRERTLTLARDPLGIKPLHISQQSDGLAFSSELKALLVLPGHEFTIDDRAVHDFLSFGHVRRPRTIYGQVSTLDPGHFLVIGPDGSPSTSAYWRPQFREAAHRSLDDWSDEMRQRLLETTARHMQSDVPVGAFLSGGIDSSAVLAAMVRSTEQPITAFTISHPGSAIDESDAATVTARHLGCRHVVAPLRMGDAIAILPGLQKSFDEPFADMAAIPTAFVSELASREVKVVLCGEGGDELFAGYKRHRNASLIEKHRRIASMLRPLARAVDRLPATSSARISLLRQHVRRFESFASLQDGYEQFFAATEMNRQADRLAFLEPDFYARFEGSRRMADLEEEYIPVDFRTNLSGLEQFLFADLSINLPSAMLTRLDRASMAHSLEARVPFLSHKMVDWALTVPTDLKLRGRTGKFIVRNAVRRWLPRQILRRPKQGFQIPMADWLRGGFGDFARSAWQDSGAAEFGYIRPLAADRLFLEHKRGHADHSRILYALTVLALWITEERASRRTLIANA